MPFDLEALIAPFRELPGVDIAIEGPAGVVLAGTSSEPRPGDALTQAIEAGPLAGGRISVWGAGAEPGLTGAFLAALVGVLAGGGSADPGLRRATMPARVGSTTSWPTGGFSSAASCPSSPRMFQATKWRATTRPRARSVATSSISSGFDGAVAP